MVTYNNDNDVPSRVKDRWTYINPRARFLHLYDVTASRADLIFSGELDFPCSGDRMRNPSITCASFSPDGVLLALGCSDNSVYVYDARFLRADGPAHLHRFRHSKRVSDRETYGVTAVEWAPTRGIMSCSPGGYGLYSGGADGAALSVCNLSPAEPLFKVPCACSTLASRQNRSGTVTSWRRCRLASEPSPSVIPLPGRRCSSCALTAKPQ